MNDCDGWFDERGIPYESSFEDAAVSEVYSWDHYDPAYKKWLIQCWFDTTYGQWNGSRFDLKESRQMMALYIRNSPYATFEELIDSNQEEPNDRN